MIDRYMRLETPAEVRRGVRMKRVALIRYKEGEGDLSCGVCGELVTWLRPGVYTLLCGCYRIGWGLKDNYGAVCGMASV